MRKTSIALAFLAFSALANAQGAKDPAQTIDLKDGGLVVVLKDGTMSHFDAAGSRVKMRDGRAMVAKDGSKLMMKNNAIWRQITEHGTLKPGH